MSRKPIQVDISTHEKLEDYKNKSRYSSLSIAIEGLLRYHDQKDSHVQISDKTKELLEEIKKELNINDGDKILQILLEHWVLSFDIKKSTMDLILKSQNSYRYY